MCDKIIDGKKHANEIILNIKNDIIDLQKSIPEFKPKLVIIQVGNKEESNVYIRMKLKAAKECGIEINHINLDDSIKQDELISIISKINLDSTIDGLIVQQPLPLHLNEHDITEKIDPSKDVDGFHSYNIGNLVKKGGNPHFISCTPMGCLELLKRENIQIAGKTAIVIGRSNTVGLPMFNLLIKENATVLLCHSYTIDLENKIKQADIIISAIGKPNFINGNWLKEGAVAIDVGINVVSDISKKSGYRYVGDIDYNTAITKVSRITPVPGGVGPMTIAMLMNNTYTSAKTKFKKK